MKQLIRLLAVLPALYVLSSCGDAPGSGNREQQIVPDSIYARYWEERQQLFPLDATANGDYRYNDKLTITIAPGFRDSLRRFYTKYLSVIHEVDSSKLQGEDRISYQLFQYEMEMGLEGLKYPSHYMPINQFWGFTLDLPVLGSGSGNQPFRNAKDYDDFGKRLAVFPAWVDTAISNMQQGMAQGWVLPKALVAKILPQLKAMLVPSEQSAF